MTYIDLKYLREDHPLRNAALDKIATEGLDKRCSAYDEDCQHVKNPLSCWIGGTYLVAGQIVEMPIADGYCPLLRSCARNENV